MTTGPNALSSQQQEALLGSSNLKAGKAQQYFKDHPELKQVDLTGNQQKALFGVAYNCS